MENKDNKDKTQSVDTNALKQALNIKTGSSSIRIKPDKKSYITKLNEQSRKKGKSNVASFIKLLVIIAIPVIIIALIAYLLLSSGDIKETGTIVIPEKLFLTTINEIYYDIDNYIGRELELEGLYDKYDYEGNTYEMIYRNSPGCCGNDGIAGFDIEYSGDIDLTPGDWIKVNGILDSYIDESDGQTYMKITANTLEKKTDEERGLEFVSK